MLVFDLRLGRLDEATTVQEMVDRFVPGALLGHIYELESGLRLRLRVARVSDLRTITELLEDHAENSQELSARRLVCFDPRHEYVLCATALIDGQETVLGVGTIGLDGGPTEPQLVLSDGEGQADVRRLLTAALVAVATTARSRAA